MIKKLKFLSIVLFLAGLTVLSCDNSCCAEEAPETENKVTLNSIDVANRPKTELYVAGEKFNPDGMVVAANYSDGTTKELKSGEFTYSPSGKLTENNTKITISYTDSGITKVTEIDIKMGYKVTVNESVNGMIVADEVKYEAKKPVKLTVTPEDRYSLESLWYEYTENSGSIRTINLDTEDAKTEYTFDMPAYDITVKAKFIPAGDQKTYSIAVNKKGEKDNSRVRFIYNDVDSVDETQERILPGTKIDFTVTPGDDCIVPEIPILVYDDERIPVTVIDADTSSYSFEMPAKNIVLEITIAKIGTYKLSTNITGKGSVELKVNNKPITHEVYLVEGTEVVATIIPADGYELSFAKINEEEVILNEDNQITFYMEGKESLLDVMFTEKQGYEVLLGVVKYGTLRLSHISAKEGTTVMITAIPDAGYADVKVITAKTASGQQLTVTKDNTGKYSFVMPEDKVTISAEFCGYKITVNNDENGTVTATEYAKAGDRVKLTAKGKENKALGAIVINNGEDSISNTRTDIAEGECEIDFEMPAADVNVTATFGSCIKITDCSYTPENAGTVELYQGETYITTGNAMYFAQGTEITVETYTNTVGDSIYEVGKVKVLGVNNNEEAVDVTEIIKDKEYKFSVPEKDVKISVEFNVSNAKRVFIDKEGLAGGTIVVKEGGKTVTSSAESWLDGDAYIVEGRTVTVSATPETGYELDTMTWNGKNITDGGTFTMPSELVEIKAKFVKKSYTLEFVSSVSNGTFSLSSDFDYDSNTKKLSPAGTIYKSGDKVPYNEVVYIIATASNSDYIEQVSVKNKQDGQMVRVDRMDKVTRPYQFNMPASDSGVTADIKFEFAVGDVNLYVNGTPVAIFYLNPTPDKATWPTLDKEYLIRHRNTNDDWVDGWKLEKGDKVQIKDKSGNVQNHWEGALGFDKDNPNYDVDSATYTAEEDGIYKMYYKIWNEYDDNDNYIGKGYSQWITIPKVGALKDADYYLCVNGVKTETFSVSTSIDTVQYPTLVKQFYLKNVNLQKDDTITIETNATTLPADGILHWEKENTVGAVGGSAFEVPTTGEYDFYFKVWQDGGTSIWVQKSAN